MKDFIRRIWDWFVNLFAGIRRDRLYHFIAGLIIAALFYIVLKMPVCIVPVIFAAFIKEFFDTWTDGNFDWIDLLATVLGGFVIQLFVIIAVLIH